MQWRDEEESLKRFFVFFLFRWLSRFLILWKAYNFKKKRFKVRSRNFRGTERWTLKSGISFLLNLLPVNWHTLNPIPIAYSKFETIGGRNSILFPPVYPLYFPLLFPSLFSPKNLVAFSFDQHRVSLFLKTLTDVSKTFLSPPWRQTTNDQLDLWPLGLRLIDCGIKFVYGH